MDSLLLEGRYEHRHDRAWYIVMSATFCVCLANKFDDEDDQVNIYISQETEPKSELLVAAYNMALEKLFAAKGSIHPLPLVSINRMAANRFHRSAGMLYPAEFGMPELI